MNLLRCTRNVRGALPVAAVALTALVFVAAAASKGDARAHLTRAVPLNAPAGTTIRVEWTVDVPDGRGGRARFEANDMFVRLLSAHGARSTVAFTDTVDGRNAADVRVPSGGIGGIQVGVRGTTDVDFILANDPFLTPGGARCDVGTFFATMHSFVWAYNRGNTRQLDRLFSRQRFAWYSSGKPGDRADPDSRNRGTLIRYFLRRHRAGDRLALRGYGFGYDRARSLGHFQVKLRRRANDARRGRWFLLEGKGALDCSRPRVTIAAMSLGAAVR